MIQISDNVMHFCFIQQVVQTVSFFLVSQQKNYVNLRCKHIYIFIFENSSVLFLVVVKTGTRCFSMLHYSMNAVLGENTPIPIPTFKYKYFKLHYGLLIIHSLSKGNYCLPYFVSGCYELAHMF